MDCNCLHVFSVFVIEAVHQTFMGHVKISACALNWDTEVNWLSADLVMWRVWDRASSEGFTVQGP